ncbi:hypothetical protein F5Y14DRAFT_257690 [Nemania sp. NC0429]|nr:hypothetical protein F5Y14DRAFT_257690 [Nemania sp. NC0429]
MNDQIPHHAENFNTQLSDYSRAHEGKTGPYAADLEVECLVVGAGFSGVFILKTLRDRGHNVVVYEAGTDIGGTWRWNCYPGAGVDTEVPAYEFSWPELWKTWNWESNFPNYQHIQAYFDHVDKAFDIRKHCSFNTVVVAAHFDTGSGRWTVKTFDGRTARAKYLILATGSTANRYIPHWPGMEKFKGIIHHSSLWPEEKFDAQGKRCAVIGTGASGVQIVQAWGPVASEVKVFQRTPNLALPMRRRELTAAEQENAKRHYPEVFKYREKVFSGFLFDFYEKNTFDDTPEDRERFLEQLWNDGGFRFTAATYKDSFVNADANKECYKFWVKKTRDRIDDPRKRDLLAPLDMPHPFGVKRPSLEVNYFEQFNRSSVDVVDVRNNPIREFDETGIVLQDGTRHDFDVIAVATGFDIVIGAMTQLGLESINKTKLEEEWKSGAETYLGLTVGGYPNMFHIYGVHAPTLVANGAAMAEIQGRWVADCIAKIERNKIKYINPKPEAVKVWKAHILELNNMTLFPTTTHSTYMGGSAPGRAHEPVCYMGGVHRYAEEIRTALDSMDGFEIVMI